MSSRFDTTQWSLVLAARLRSGPGAREALAELCEAYWFPLYAFVRRQGHDPDRARDLTQAYFLRLLEKDVLDDVDPAAGRFRSFLLASMKHFLINDWKSEHTARRGGKVTTFSLDFEDAEGRLRAEPADHETPDRVYERRWAQVVLQHTTEALRREQPPGAAVKRFDRLVPFLTGSDARSYAAIAAELGRSESAIKMAVHRLRRRFGALLREEIARTVADPMQVDAEIRYLFDALA